MPETIIQNVALPNFKNQFLIKVGEEFVGIAGMTSLSISLSKNIESYTDLMNGGWTSKGIVGGEMVVSSDIKRIAGDAGNDAVFETLLYLDPENAAKVCRIVLSDGRTIEGTFIVAINDFLGDAAALESMSVEFHCNGEPTLVEATGE